MESAENADAGWVDGSVSVERNPSPAPMCLCLQMRTHYATPRTIQPSHSGGSATAKFRARMRRGAQRLEPKVEAALGLAGSSPSSASAMAAEAEAARGAVGEEALRRLDVLDDGGAASSPAGVTAAVAAVAAVIGAFCGAYGRCESRIDADGRGRGGGRGARVACRAPRAARTPRCACGVVTRGALAPATVRRAPSGSVAQEARDRCF